MAERRLQLAGVSTAVLEGGAGPPIVLLHGPGDFAGMWMRVIPELATTQRVIAPDLPGHGTSVAGRRLDADGIRAWLSGLIERTCSAPTVLIWGRHDRANRLRIAEIASHRYGWPLHVIENCADDPPRDQPRAFLDALRVALGTERSPRIIANRRPL